MLRRIRNIALVATALVVIGALILAISTLVTYSNIKRVSITPTGSHLAAANFTKGDLSPDVVSVLIASVGSRGLTQAQGKALDIPDLANRGADGLTDILMLALINTHTGNVSLLSIPRDTWVISCACKINSIYNSQGAPALLDQVELITGIRPAHLVLVNFSAFANLIDSVGGVSVYVPNTIMDNYSHLPQTDAGCQVMNGATALAYVRSRHTQTLIDGSWVSDASGTDFGRINRQQEVIKALSKKLLSASLPLHVPSILSAMGSGLTLDSSLSLSTTTNIAANLVSALAGSNISGFSLPSRTRYINGQSAVLVVPPALVGILNKWRSAVGLPPIQATTASTSDPLPEQSPSTTAIPVATPGATPSDTPTPTDTTIYYPYGGSPAQGIGVNAPSC